MLKDSAHYPLRNQSEASWGKKQVALTLLDNRHVKRIVRIMIASVRFPRRLRGSLYGTRADVIDAPHVFKVLPPVRVAVSFLDSLASSSDTNATTLRHQVI